MGSVIDYGADPTGGADSSTAIRAALADGDAYLPPGVYVVSRDGANPWALAVPAGARLHGPGTVRLAAGSGESVRLVQLATSGTVEGVTLDGNRAAQSASTNPQRHGILITGGGHYTVRGVTLTGMAGDGVCMSGDITSTTITGVRTRDCQRNGVTVGSGAITDLHISGCDLRCDVQPIDSEPESGGPVRVTITGNSLHSVGGDYALTITAARDWIVTGNVMRGAVYLTGSTHVVLSHNIIDATSSPLHAVYVRGGSDRLIVTDNVVRAAPDMNGIHRASRPEYWCEERNLIETCGTGRARFA